MVNSNVTVIANIPVLEDPLNVVIFIHNTYCDCAGFLTINSVLEILLKKDYLDYTIYCINKMIEGFFHMCFPRKHNVPDDEHQKRF